TAAPTDSTACSTCASARARGCFATCGRSMGSEFDPRLAHALAEALGAPVRQHRSLAGGDIARAYRVELGSGAVVFVKTLPRAGGLFEAEARGLAWLGE